MAPNHEQPPPARPNSTVRPTSASFIKLSGLFVLLMVVSGADLAMRGLHRNPMLPVWSVPGGESERGRAAIRSFGCGACHTIPGIRDATGRLGPDLNNLRQQIYIAGIVPNTPDNLIQWLLNPEEVSPGTAMPNLGITEAEARDIAAYFLLD